MEKERKLQILKAAQKRFSKHGLGKTTLDEVARDLRMGKATLYYYFVSKEDLYYQTIEWEYDQFLEEIKTLFNAQGDLNEKFLKYFELKESAHLRLKLVYELFQYAFKDDLYETENNLLRKIVEKETEYISTLFPSKKDKAETAYFLVLKSWGEMLNGKIKGIISPGKEFNKTLVKKVIDSILW